MSADSTGPAERPSRARRWLGLAIVGVLFAGLGAAMLVRQLGGRSGTDEDRVPRETGRRAEHVLVALEPEGDGLPALAVVAATDRGGVVAMLPATTVVEVPGTGPLTLARALRETGTEGLATAIANVVRMEVPHVLVGSSAAVAALVDAVGVTVDVPEDVATGDATLYTRGPARMGGSDFVRYMTASFEGKTELDRLIRQGAAWRGLLRSISSGGADALQTWSGDADRTAAAGIVRAAARDPVVMSLPTTRLSIAGEDLYRVDDEGLDPMRDALSPFVTTTRRAGRRVRFLVGTVAQAGPAAAARLIDAGYVIVLTGPASRAYATTEVVVTAGNTEAEQAADEVVRLLGTGAVVLTDRQTSVADIMLVVGSDWAKANGFTAR